MSGRLGWWQTLCRVAGGKGASTIEEAKEGPQGEQLLSVVAELLGGGKQAKQFALWMGFVRASLAAWFRAPLCDDRLLGLGGLQEWAEKCGSAAFRKASGKRAKDLRGRLQGKNLGTGGLTKWQPK